MWYLTFIKNYLGKMPLNLFHLFNIFNQKRRPNWGVVPGTPVLGVRLYVGVRKVFKIR